MITVTNDGQYVLKVMYQEKGKAYGTPVDGQDVQLTPFDEALVPVGEKLDLPNIKGTWLRIVEMGVPGQTNFPDTYFG